MADTLTLDVERRFGGGVIIAAALSVPLAAGEVLALFGPSGAGKTTVLRMIAGLEQPDSGSIRFGDTVWFDGARHIALPAQQRRAGYVFQQPALFPHLTVRGNVEFGAVGPAAPERVGKLMRRVGVDSFAGRTADRVSGGEAQRIALARALAAQPRLLLLDEPFASLDGPSRAKLRGDFRPMLREAGLPAVLVTHDRNEVIALGDTLALMIAGRIRQVGAVGDVLARPIDAEAAHAVGVETVVAAIVAASDGGLLSIRIGPAALNALAGDDPVAPGDTVLACIRAEDVTLEQQASAATSARNHLPGRVVRIDPEGPLDRVTLDCGFPLASLITRRSRDELRLAEGSMVAAAIKATAIHLVPRS